MDDVQGSDLVSAAQALCEALAALRFGDPVTHVYNPLEYAAANYRAYAERYGQGPKRVLVIGMNPGPWGMAQTGIPFGDGALVRDWLKIDHAVGKPLEEHPKRPVQGTACPRSEVSGTRFWGAIREHFQTPERFFERFFVDNYCPLAFMEQSGLNRTPDRLPIEQRGALFAACDRHLRQIVLHLQPEWVIGVGGFAETRAQLALEGLPVRVGRIHHPSPANPRTNVENWSLIVHRELTALGICSTPPPPSTAKRAPKKAAPKKATRTTAPKKKKRR